MLKSFVRHLAAAAFAATAFFGLSAAPAVADQGSLCMPTVGVYSGLTAMQNVNNALQALVTMNYGATAPTNPCGGAPLRGQMWLDTSVSPAKLKLYDGTSWSVFGYQDATNHYVLAPIGGGTANVASASTADLWSVSQNLVTITGTTAITQLANASAVPGTVKLVVFSGALTLTYDATKLILPTGASITTAAGDQMMVVATSSTNVRVLAYTRADGSPLAASTFGSNVIFSGIITPAAISGTNNDYTPAGLATASVIRLSATSNATLTGLAAQSNGTLVYIENINSSTSITLADANAGSVAANRFSIGVDYEIGPLATVLLRYDNTLARWTVAQSPLPATNAQALAGTATAPYMTPYDVAAYVTQGYRFTGIQTITANGTYTATAGTRAIMVMMVGGGGGGGSGKSTSSDGVGTGGGGGAGEFVWFFKTSPSASYSVIIGTAGSGGTAGGNGTAGGDTCILTSGTCAAPVGLLALAKGGSAGAGRNCGGSCYMTADGGLGGTGGTVPAGGWQMAGNPGQHGETMYCCAGGNESGGGGPGGNGPWGGGGFSDYGNGSTLSNGGAGTAPGAGGGGGIAVDTNSSSTGGAGYRGEVRIFEYN